MGIPYLLGGVPKLASLAGGDRTNEAAPFNGLDPTAEAVAGAADPNRPAPAPLEGIPVQKLADVLRFDITPDWVYQRWSRKSVALADLDFYGVRVPLVTGTKIEDLAGSLTYYFSRQGRLERIVFVGRCGDPRPLTALLVDSYGFRQVSPLVAGEHLYEVLWNGHAMSQLKIRPASVLWAAAPHASYEVNLDLQRPGAPRYLPSTTVPAAASAEPAGQRQS